MSLNEEMFKVMIDSGMGSLIAERLTKLSDEEHIKAILKVIDAYDVPLPTDLDHRYYSMIPPQAREVFFALTARQLTHEGYVANEKLNLGEGMEFAVSLGMLRISVYMLRQRDPTAVKGWLLLHKAMIESLKEIKGDKS